MLLLCSFLILTACGFEILDTPTNLRVDPATQILMWDEVEWSTGGYNVEINGNLQTVATNSLDLSRRVPGTYHIRVQALTNDRNYFRNSLWSYEIEWIKPAVSGLEYRRINSGTEYAVVGMGSASSDVVIGDFLNGRPITTIAANAFSRGGSRLFSVVIGRNIRSIERSAFANCINLQTVIFAEGSQLTNIGERAFQGCRSLTNISIPDTVINIGARAFQGAASLTSITIPYGITSIKEGVFFACASLETIVLPNSLVSIGDEAFFNNHSLKQITIPLGVMSIGDSAFENSSSLKSIVLPDSLLSIGDRTFFGCSSLEDINIPKSVIRVGRNAFGDSGIWANTSEGVVYAGGWVVGFRASAGDDADNGDDYFDLDSGISPLNTVNIIIKIEDGVVGIADRAFFNLRNLTSVTLPESLLIIGSQAFAFCTSLTSIIIPQNVQRIGSQAFFYSGIWNNVAVSNVVYAGNWAVGLRPLIVEVVPGLEITMPIVVGNLLPTTRGISDNAFNNVGLLGINLPQNLEFIGEGAFRNSHISNIEIPSGIMSIEANVFRNTALTNIVIPDNVTSIGGYAFFGAENLVDIIIPDTVSYIGEYAFSDCIRLEYVTFSGISRLTYIEQGVFRNNVSLREINIPNSIVRIGNHAFRGAVNLTSIVLPDNVLSVGDFAFYENIRLTQVVIGDGVTHIGSHAFFGCIELESIVLGNSVVCIGDFAFFGCRGLENITIPNSVTNIGNHAFRNTGLISITIPSSVTHIGIHAFHGSYLTIYREGINTLAYWDNVWNSSNRPVVWGVTLSDGGYIASFLRTATNIFNPNIETNPLTPFEISVPFRMGYIFGGWANSIDNAIHGIASHQAREIINVGEGLTIWAIWICHEFYGG